MKYKKLGRGRKDHGSDGSLRLGFRHNSFRVSELNESSGRERV